MRAFSAWTKPTRSGPHSKVVILGRSNRFRPFSSVRVSEAKTIPSLQSSPIPMVIACCSTGWNRRVNGVRLAGLFMAHLWTYRRVGAVTLLVASAYWVGMGHKPDAIFAFITSLVAYISVEISQRLKRPKDEREKQNQATKHVVPPVQSDDPQLSDDALAALYLAHDCYPDRLVFEKFRERLHLDQIGTELALRELTTAQFLDAPEWMALWRQGEPDPSGYLLTDAGKEYVRKRKG